MLYYDCGKYTRLYIDIYVLVSIYQHNHTLFYFSAGKNQKTKRSFLMPSGNEERLFMLAIGSIYYSWLDAKTPQPHFLFANGLLCRMLLPIFEKKGGIFPLHFA